jgi:hypothetical protein
MAAREFGFNGIQPLVKRMLQKEDVPVIIRLTTRRHRDCWYG